jgi:hypothetical protein
MIPLMRTVDKLVMGRSTVPAGTTGSQWVPQFGMVDRGLLVLDGRGVDSLIGDIVHDIFPAGDLRRTRVFVDTPVHLRSALAEFDNRYVQSYYLVTKASECVPQDLAILSIF